MPSIRIVPILTAWLIVGCGGDAVPAGSTRVTDTPDAHQDSALEPPDAGSADAARCGASVCKSDEYCTYEDGACGEVDPGSAVCRKKPLDCGGTVFTNLLTTCTCKGERRNDGCLLAEPVRRDQSCFDSNYFACGHGFCERGTICADLPGNPGGSYSCLGPIDGCSSCDCMPNTVTTRGAFSMTFTGCTCSGEGDALKIECDGNL